MPSLNERPKRLKHEFSAKIHKIGINPCVDVPRRISQAFNKRGYIPVLAILNRQRLRSTLVPIGNRRHRLYINGVLKANLWKLVDNSNAPHYPRAYHLHCS